MSDESYRRKMERSRQREAEQTARGQEIGGIPAPKNKRRRAKARDDFEYFCRTYFPNAFTLPWSKYHRKSAAKIERAVREGGVFAFAEPRGFGKTTRCEWATLYATLYAFMRYVMLIGATENASDKRLKSIKSEVRFNDKLREDFPEVCIPFEKLGGEARRAAGQKCRGEPTNIEWTQSRIIYPTIAGSDASGAIIEVVGITGEIRGRNHKLADGTILRPDLAICDDPQTRESARSTLQSGAREETIAGDVTYLAGPGKPTSILMPCTVIYKGDLADRMLDRSLHPEFQGERTKMVLSFPTNMKLWENYRDLREQSFAADGDGREATRYYKKNRKAMDKGAEVAWPERFNDNELSAVQHAMNLMFRDEPSFYAEYQNEPVTASSDADDLPTAEEISGKLNRLPRGRAAIDVSRVTAFIDVQKKLLPWVVVGWADGFTGYVLDYGTWPDQKRTRWSLADAKITLAKKFPKAGMEGAIYGGLEALTAELLGGVYQRDDGAELKVDRCLIDANWGNSTDVVYQFCRSSKHAAVLLPSHGKGITASNVPMVEYKRKKGERLGHNWRIPAVTGKRQVRHVTYDTNFWKSFIFARFAVAIGDPGCLSLFGRTPHRLFAEQLHAEYPVKTEGRGRTVFEWKQKPNHPDNHWLDCIVGSAVAASMCGVALMGKGTGSASGTPTEKKKPGKSRVSYL